MRVKDLTKQYDGKTENDDASVFEFSGNSSGASFQSGKDRQSAYMIRCVRNEIPESKMEAGAISSPTYQGTEKGVKAYFGIKSNVPYWTATLVTGEGAGTAAIFAFT